jgi:sugar lactone lactonase YvrE
MAMDDEGTLFVGMQDHVEVFSKAWENSIWPLPGEKAYLTSIAVDERYVYVADAGSRRVWRYGKEGGEPLEIGRKDLKNGVQGFFVPSPFFDVDIGTDGSLWAVNPGYHTLENYRPDGMPISSWKKSSFSIDGFSGCCNPSHFALMPDGSFVTAEKGLPRVKIHNQDGELRCVVAAPDQFDDGVTGLDVAADDKGRIYVLDQSQGAIRIFEEKQ